MDGVCGAAAVGVGRACCRQRGYEAVDVKREAAGPKRAVKNRYETVSPASYPRVEGIAKERGAYRKKE